MASEVKSFVLGFVVGVFACIGFVTYYDDIVGSRLFEVSRKVKSAAESRIGDIARARRSR